MRKAILNVLSRKLGWAFQSEAGKALRDAQEGEEIGHRTTILFPLYPQQSFPWLCKPTLGYFGLVCKTEISGGEKIKKESKGIPRIEREIQLAIWLDSYLN